MLVYPRSSLLPPILNDVIDRYLKNEDDHNRDEDISQTSNMRDSK